MARRRYARKSFLLVYLAVGLGVYFVIFGLPFKPFTFYSVAKSVPIQQVGYDKVEQFWILSTVVNEKEGFKMVLPSSTSKDTGVDQQAVAQSEVGIVISPKEPTSQTGLLFLNRQFVSSRGAIIAYGYAYVPGTDVDDSSWLTTAKYRLEVYKSENFLAGKDINVNYKNPAVVYLEVPDGKVTVNNLGMIPQGVEVPSGDLVVVEDPRQTSAQSEWDFSSTVKKRVWTASNLDMLLKRWEDSRYYIPYGSWSWVDVLNWADANGATPQDVPLANIRLVEYLGSAVQMTYSGITFAGNIALYIPASLADTLVLQQYAAKPVITSVSPSSLPEVEEGKSAELNVSVRNDGTDGSISVSVTSNYYSAISTTSSYLEMKQGSSNTFKFKMQALEVERDEQPQISILAQGRGGTDSRSIVGSIKNTVRSTGGSSGGEFDLGKLFANLFKPFTDLFKIFGDISGLAVWIVVGIFGAVIVVIAAKVGRGGRVRRR